MTLKQRYQLDIETLKSDHQQELTSVQAAINEAEINRLRLEAEVLKLLYTQRRSTNYSYSNNAVRNSNKNYQL